jgi:23S rRNA pseudouridine2457 synthase
LLAPKNKRKKTYLAQIDRVPSADALATLERGVIVDGERTLPAVARLVDEPAFLWPRDPPIRFRKSVPTSFLELTIVEGRNRQVRKMTAAIGHPTLRLVRISIGALALVDVAPLPNQWRVLDDDGIARLLKPT